MNYLLIENKGEIDINALILMGGTTKRDDESKIGFFGSGNKYAIALLLKEKVPFRIFAGNSEVIFETQLVSFRDKSFEKIRINGQDTSLTTDMGPQWQIWQAVREFVSNALDEGGYNIVNKVSYFDIKPKEGYTRIYLPHTSGVEEVISNWDSYFAFDRTDELVSVSGNKVYPQTDKREHLLLYRKGIRCYKAAIKTLFQYDIKELEINESRVVENSYLAKTQITKFIADNATIDIAFRFLNEAHKSEYWEYDFPWKLYVNGFNHNWLTAIGNRILIVNDVAGWYQEEISHHPHFLVTKDLAKAIRIFLPQVKIYGLRDTAEKGVFRVRQTTPKMTHMLKKAQDFFQETNYEIKYPIIIGQFDREDQLGGIGVKEIHLSEKVFDMGMKELVTTIIEGNEHLKTNYLDCSREFQNHWINLFVTEKEERFAYFL